MSEQRKDREPARDEPQAMGPLILLVDDYADNREMYAQFLRHCGFRVAEAANGLEALEHAFTQRPDLIVMDLSLPGLDGWEATRRLKSDERTKRIPVVALTGHALDGQDKGAKKAGCDEYVAKPCLPQDLAAAIRRILDSPASRTRPKTGR